MKKKFTLILAIIALLSISFAARADETEELKEKEYQFRGYKWLASYREIKLNEYQSGMVLGVDYDTFDTEDENSFFVKTSVAGLDANARFLFNDDWKLTMGMYEITTTHETPKDYYSDYVTLQESLRSLYKDPIETSSFGFDGVDMSKPEDVISTLMNNGGLMWEIWCSSDESGIVLLCYASEGVIRPALIYAQNISDISDMMTKFAKPNTNGL